MNNALLYQTQKENNGLELVCLLSACSDAIRENLDPDTIIGFLTVNKASETLFNKLFPSVKPVDKVYHYEKDFGEETLDEHSAGFDEAPEFEMLSEEKMVCNNCRHCMGKVLECGIYLQKPDAVLDGGKCLEFEKKR